MLKSLLFLSILVALANALNQAQSSNLEVETTYGTIRGVQLEEDHVAWLSIPFAKPPLGDLRFRPAEAPEPWDTVLETTKRPSACMQSIDEFFGDFEGSQQWNPKTNISEDCLYVNVHKANNEEVDKLLPVLVWVHGGGFIRGSSVLDNYYPRQFVNQGKLVFVSIQYRVGINGFLSFGADSSVPGNIGLLDQVKALEWVRDNIQSFGGNPNDVTLMGESAGAASVAIHLVSPLSQELFHKTIMQSSGLNPPWGFIEPDVALKRARKLAENVDCDITDSNEELIECLRGKDPQELLDKEFSVDEINMNFLPFVPTVDGTVIDQSTDELVKRLHEVKKPLLIGSNANEGYWSLLYFLTDVYPNKELSDEEKKMTREEYLENVKAIYPFYSDAVNQLIAHEHEFIFPSTDVDRYFKTLEQITSRSEFVCDPELVASTISQNGNRNVFRYNYNHQSSTDPWPSWSGVKHAHELKYVFGDPLNNPEEYTPEEVDLAAAINQYWTNFVVHGNPNGESGEEPWPSYSAPSWSFLELSTEVEGGSVEQEDMHNKCQFWNEILPLFTTD